MKARKHQHNEKMKKLVEETKIVIKKIHHVYYLASNYLQAIRPTLNYYSKSNSYSHQSTHIILSLISLFIHSIISPLFILHLIFQFYNTFFQPFISSSYIYFNYIYLEEKNSHGINNNMIYILCIYFL